jgi:uncharacterized protein (DUF58 family)
MKAPDTRKDAARIGGIDDTVREDPEALRSLLARVRRIEVAAQRLVNEQLSGRYHSVFKGRGMSFDEVRPYNPGDEVRLIDWNVSARTGQIHVKRFVEERELTVVILADASLSMDFGLSSATWKSTGRSEEVQDVKRELAAQVAACIALSAQINGDRVGLVTFGNGVQRFIPPRKGRRHALRVIREVLAMRADGAPTDLSEAFSFVGRVLKRRAALFVVSDFHVPDFERALRVATRRHDVHALIVRDPVEDALFEGGIVSLRDAETGELAIVPATKRFVQRYREASAAEKARLDQVLARNRVPGTTFSTAAPYERTLAGHFARLKGETL